MIVVITSCAPTVAFRKPAMPADRRPGRRPDDEREQHVQHGAQTVERRADPDGEDRTGQELPLAADVEEPATERERDGEPDEDQRRRRDERLLEVERRRGRDPRP